MEEKKLDRGDILRILKEIELPLGEYWVVSGAALVLYGVREFTRDVDVGCTAALIDALIKGGCPWRKSERDGARIVALGEDAEALENWNVEEIGEIEGFPVAGLKDIRRQKEELGRDKDWADIRLIDDFLAR